MSSSIYPGEALMQVEAIKIKKILDKEELNDFTISNGWLESWKKAMVCEKKNMCRS